MNKIRVIFIGISILFILCMLGIVIYTLIAYGGKPISEVPTWAWFILN